MSIEHRDVWLIWELTPPNYPCLRAIDEDAETVRRHLIALNNEARISERKSRFDVEKVQTNHAFGHTDCTAAAIIVRAAQRSTEP